MRLRKHSNQMDRLGRKMAENTELQLLAQNADQKANLEEEFKKQAIAQVTASIMQSSGQAVEPLKEMRAMRAADPGESKLSEVHKWPKDMVR